MRPKYLVVYRCYDNQEEESCWASDDAEEIKSWLDGKPNPPSGFKDRDGYYFYEEVCYDYD